MAILWPIGEDMMYSTVGSVQCVQKNASVQFVLTLPTLWDGSFI